MKGIQWREWNGETVKWSVGGKLEGRSVCDDRGEEEKREGEKEEEETEEGDGELENRREMWKSERRGSKWGKENESGCKNEMRKRLILEEGFQGRKKEKCGGGEQVKRGAARDEDSEWWEEEVEKENGKGEEPERTRRRGKGERGKEAVKRKDGQGSEWKGKSGEITERKKEVS